MPPLPPSPLEADDVRGLARCRIGLVPLGWPDPGHDLGRRLRRIAELGFAGIQFGDPGPEPGAVRDAFEDAGLVVAERYFPIRCTVDGPVPGAADEGRAHLEQLVALNGDHLVAAIDGSAERDRFAGRAQAAPRLTDDGWAALAELMTALAVQAADLGVRTSFHPHAGTFVETPDETAELMRRTDAARVGLCLDTGHWTVGGGDPVAAIRQYGDRLTHLHVKDVDGQVLAELRDGSVASFTEAVERVVFSTLGTGILPLTDVLSALAQERYAGWLMIEQDSFVGDAAQAAAANRSALMEALERPSSSSH